MNHDDRVAGYMVENWMEIAEFAYPMGGELISDHDDSRSHGYHDAVDIMNDVGVNVHAARGGTAYAGYGDKCGYYVKIYHEGDWSTLYCHLDSVSVYDGESVSQFEKIGENGCSGNATCDEPHVHFEIMYNGDEVWWPTVEYVDMWPFTGVPKDFF